LRQSRPTVALYTQMSEPTRDQYCFRRCWRSLVSCHSSVRSRYHLPVEGGSLPSRSSWHRLIPQAPDLKQATGGISTAPRQPSHQSVLHLHSHRSDSREDSKAFCSIMHRHLNLLHSLISKSGQHLLPARRHRPMRSAIPPAVFAALVPSRSRRAASALCLSWTCRRLWTRFQLTLV